MVLGQKVAIFDWEWGRQNSATRRAENALANQNFIVTTG